MKIKEKFQLIRFFWENFNRNALFLISKPKSDSMYLTADTASRGILKVVKTRIENIVRVLLVAVLKISEPGHKKS